MEKRYYIAYGSNLNIPQMRMRCPGARIIGTSVIEGYRLLFKGSRTGKVRQRKVFVYIMHEDRPLGLPSESYMETCRQGYRSFGFDEAFLEQAYADSREEFPDGWKTGDACFMATNRKNGCTGNYTVLGFDGKYFWLQNSRGSRYRASAGRMFRSREAALAPRQENTESGGNHDER